LARPSAICSAAFTLVEILVTIALLSVIVLGLFAMFHQTQRAFQSSMTQTDVLEAGRAVTDMLARELEQIAPSGRMATNLHLRIVNAVPLTQPLPGTATNLQRLNLLEDFFVLTRQNQSWTGIGYCVRTPDSAGGLQLPETGPGSGQIGVGSLYRFTQTINFLQTNGVPVDPSQLCANFISASFLGKTVISNRICDGVVHFRFRLFATNGLPIFSDGSHTNACFHTNALAPGYTFVRQAATHPNPFYPDQLDACYFWSNAVPAYLEFELGLLEPRILARYNAIGDPAARLRYLQREDISTHVHLFRQRVPVRNVDPLAYQ
jgi:type II secretory pathway pseudopilin PulG